MTFLTLEYEPDQKSGKFQNSETVEQAIGIILKTSGKKKLFIDKKSVIVRSDVEDRLKSPGDYVVLNDGEKVWLILAAQYPHF
ncbi:MAG: hypothetical protein AABY93_03625 [Bacteroidota bacterium]